MTGSNDTAHAMADILRRTLLQSPASSLIHNSPAASTTELTSTNATARPTPTQPDCTRSSTASSSSSPSRSAAPRSSTTTATRPASSAATTTTTTSSADVVAVVADLLSAENYSSSNAPKYGQISGILSGFRFVIIGSFNGWTQSSIKSYIQSHGGRVDSSVSMQGYAICSYNTFLKRNTKKSSKLSSALQFNIPCIKLDFITDSISAGTIEDPRKYTWPMTSSTTNTTTSGKSRKASPHSSSTQASKRVRLNCIEKLADLEALIKKMEDYIAAQQYPAAITCGSRMKGLLALDWKIEENMQAKSKFLALTALAYSLSRNNAQYPFEIHQASALVEEALRLHPKNSLAYFVRGRDRYDMSEFDTSLRDLKTYLSMEKNGMHTTDANVLVKKCQALLLSVEYGKLTASHAWKQKYIEYPRSINDTFSEERVNQDMLNLYLDYTSSTLLKAAEVSKEHKSKIYEHLQERLDIAFKKKAEDEEEIVLEKSSNAEGFNGFCPITSDRIRDPLRSKCNHVFDQEGILFLLKNRSSIRCPIAGCNQVIQASDLVFDPILADELKTMNLENDESDDDDDTPPTMTTSSSSYNGRLASQHTNVIVLDDSDSD